MAEATIDELEIKIESDSNDAAQAIDRFTQSLERLLAPVQALTGSGSGLAKLSKQLEKLSALSAAAAGLSNLDKVAQAANSLKALDNLSGAPNVTSYVKALNKLAQAGASVQAIAQFPDVTTQLTTLTAALNMLRSVQDIRLTGITNGLSKLPAAIQAINAMPDINAQKIRQLSRALSPLSGLNTRQISSLVSALNKLPQAANQVNQIDFTRFANSIQQLNTSLEPLVQTAERAGAGLTAIATILQYTQRNTNNTRQLGNTLGNLTVKSMLSWGSLIRLKNVLTECFKVSSQYVENLNLFNVTMGKSAATAMDFAEKVNDALGIDVSDWTRYQGFFQSVGKGFGVASEKADLMSKNLTQLAYDISSFYNISTDEAYNKVQSGFAGELEPLRRLGFALDEATLKQVAFNHGITQSYENMTQAQKAQLRYVAMIEQAKNIGVTGDMSRTIDTAANGVRVLEARIQQLARAVGNMLLPMLSAILPYVTAFVQVVTEAAQALANIFGFELPKIELGNISSGYDDVATAADDATAATEKFKGSLAGVDQLNIIGSHSDKNGTGTGYNTDLNIELPTYDFLNGVESKTKEIAENMKQWFVEALPWIEAVGAAIAGLFIGRSLSDGIILLGNLKTAFSQLGSSIINSKNLVGLAGGLAAGASSGVLLYNSIKNLITGTGKLEDSVGQLIIGVTIAATAFIGFIAASNPIGAVITMIGALAGVFAGVAVAIKENDDKLAEFQQGLADTIVYSDNGGISISGLSDGFTDYFNNISSHNNDILENTKAFEDNCEKIDEAAKSIYNLTDKYSALGETMTAEDAQKIADSLKIISKGVSDNLGLATQSIVDTLKGKFSELATQMGKDIDGIVGKWRLLENMGNNALAGLKQESAEIVAKFETGDYTESDLARLDEIVRQMAIPDTGTVEQKSFEQALKRMTNSDINFESPEELEAALEQVQSSAEAARTSVNSAWAAQIKEIDDMKAWYVNTGLDARFDEKMGNGAFDRLFTDTRDVLDAGYQQQLNDIGNSVGAYVAMLYSKLNEYVNSAEKYATPTVEEETAGFLDEWLSSGLVMSGESAYNRAKAYAKERIRSGYDEQFGSIYDFAKDYDINISQYKDIGKYLLEGMASGAIDSSGTLSQALTIASQDGIDALKDYLGIHSPSKVFAELGGYMMEGLAEGITDGEENVLNAIDTAAVKFAANASANPKVGFAWEGAKEMYSNNAPADTSVSIGDTYITLEVDGEEIASASQRIQGRQVAMANGR